MALQVISSGRDLEGFKRAVANTSGSGVTVLEIDVWDEIGIPILPDIPSGAILKASLPALDLSIRAIPGVHLVTPSTYTVRSGIGTLRVRLRTNPLPLIPFAVGVAISAILIWRIRSWRILQDIPTEVPPAGGTGAVADQGAAKQFLLIMGLGLIGLAAFLVVRR